MAGDAQNTHFRKHPNQPLVDVSVLLTAVSAAIHQAKTTTQQMETQLQPILQREMEAGLGQCRSRAIHLLGELQTELTQSTSPADLTITRIQTLCGQLNTALAAADGSAQPLADSLAGMLQLNGRLHLADQWHLLAQIFSLATLQDAAQIAQTLTQLQHQARSRQLNLSDDLHFNATRFNHLARSVDLLQAIHDLLGQADNSAQQALTITATFNDERDHPLGFTLGRLSDLLADASRHLTQATELLTTAGANLPKTNKLRRAIREADALLRAGQRALFYAQQGVGVELSVAWETAVTVQDLKQYRLAILNRAINPARDDLSEAARQCDLALVRWYALELATGHVYRRAHDPQMWWHHWRLADGYQPDDPLADQAKGVQLYRQLLRWEQQDPPPAMTKPKQETRVSQTSKPRKRTLRQFLRRWLR